MKLVYVFDAYCGWSHGFSGTLREVAFPSSRAAESRWSLAGCSPGRRRVPIREFGYVQGANAKIAN